MLVRRVGLLMQGDTMHSSSCLFQTTRQFVVLSQYETKTWDHHNYCQATCSGQCGFVRMW